MRSVQILTRGSPPLFIALAGDNPLFGNSDFGLVENWTVGRSIG